LIGLSFTISAPHDPIYPSCSLHPRLSTAYKEHTYKAQLIKNHNGIEEIADLTSLVLKEGDQKSTPFHPLNDNQVHGNEYYQITPSWPRARVNVINSGI